MKSVFCLVFLLLFYIYSVKCADNKDSPMDLLFRAVENNDLDTLKKIMESSKDLPSKKDYVDTLLQIAVLEQYLSIVRYLVTDQHANINKQDELGYPIMFRAAEEGLLDSVKLLLELGADKNVPVPLDGSTLLHQAAKGGNVELLRFLLPYFDVNVKSSFGATPAFFAAKEGKVEALRFLLENKADPFAVDKDGSTLLHAAVESNKVDMIKVLIRFKPLINTADQNGNLPIDIITNRPAVEELVNAGSNIRDNTIINYYNIGDIDTVEYLVIRSGKVNLRLKDTSDKCGETLLMILLKGTPPYDKMKLLLDKGADINMKYCDGMTALHRAANYGGENYQKILQLLLDHKAEINAQDSRGRTPLDLAVNENVAAYLRKFGGISGLKPSSGKPLLQGN